MIDYEKLKLAHELAEKYSTEIGMSVDITVRYSVSKEHPVCFYLQVKSNLTQRDYNIDDLVKRLTKLTQPKSPFNIGDTVWMAGKYFVAHSEEVIGIERLGETWKINGVPERFCFKSKEALCKGFINHWENEIWK